MQTVVIVLKIRTIGVSQLNTYIKNVLDNDPILSNIKLRGEVSNFKVHSSGHVYLSLKDKDSKINCMISRNNFNKELEIEEGSKVIATGYVSSYIRGGAYQLYIQKIELEGQGDLHLRFLELKKKLEKEGLFDPRYKKQIPKFPKKIGVITSSTGAVIRDIINVVERRYPKVDIKLYPATVQGPSSKDSLIAGLRFFNMKKEVDTIIIGRGGGSLEELWSFNEEELAMEIAASNIPVISAVGHETDFTICDFVSDLRAPTPSAAAELATPNLKTLEHNMDVIMTRISRGISSKLRVEEEKLKNTRAAYLRFAQRSMFTDRSMELDDALDILNLKMEELLRKKREELNLSAASMAGLNPFNVFDRGYTLAQKGEKTVNKSSEVEVGDKLSLRFKDADIYCEVEKIEERIDNGRN